jgi:hypothetical protein
VYVLGKGLSATNSEASTTTESSTKLHLKDGEAVTAKWVVGGNSSTSVKDTCCRSITVVSSTLASLFPSLAEEAPAPASAVVVFPSGSLSLDNGEDLPPVHIFIHSSDTGECPLGQSILYAATSLSSEMGFDLLNKATDALLAAVDDTPAPTSLWSMRYKQRASSGSEPLPPTGGHILSFPPPSMDLAFDDVILDNVKEVWQKIMGDDAGEFLSFKDREAYDDDE